MPLTEIIRDWWPIGFAIVTGIGGAWLAVTSRQTRNIWRIEHLEKTAADIDHEVEKLKTLQSKSDINMQVIEVTLKQIKDIMTEIRSDLRGKADKPDR